MTEVTKVDEVLDFIKSIDVQGLRWEQQKLQGIRAWAMKQIGVDYGVGDRVEIKQYDLGIRRNSGWWHYREALVPGATAVVQGIDFSTYSGEWVVDVVLDREWSLSEWTGMPGAGPDRRYWNGPVADTPEGMTPPGAYDQEHFPNGRKHTFCLLATHLRAHRDTTAGVE